MRKLGHLIAFFAILLAPFFSYAQNAPGEYEEFHSLAAHVRQRFSESRYFYVGVGRSPAPLMAILQNEGPASAVNMPFSSAGFALDIGLGENLDHPHLIEWREKIFRHFDRFIPLDKVGSRRVLFVDFIVSGVSLPGLRKLIGLWIENRKLKLKVEYLGLQSRQRGARMGEAYLGHSNVHLIDFDDQTLRRNIVVQKYDRWAEYGSWDIHALYEGKEIVEQPSPRTRPYEQLKKMMREGPQTYDACAKFLNNLIASTD